MPSCVPETKKQTTEKESKLHNRDIAATDASTSAQSSQLSRAFAQLLNTLLARIARLAALFSISAHANVDAITNTDTNTVASTIDKHPTTATPTATTPTTSMSIISATTKTVVILGCAYGGARAAQILAAGLPAAWSLVVLDRNSHANQLTNGGWMSNMEYPDVYVMPRFAVLPGHEYKAFIPYTNVFLQNADKKEAEERLNEKPEETERFTVLHAQVTALRTNSIRYKLLNKKTEETRPEGAHKADTEKKEENEDEEETLNFDFAIYALGAHMPPPLDLWGSSAYTPYSGLKPEGCAFFVDKQAEIARVQGGRVLVVGGGALGIQFATDIKAVYPSTGVTLLHSRERLLPRFAEEMHEEVLRSCATLGVDVILGERLDLGSLSTKEIKNEGGDVRVQKVVRTVTGREIVADLVLMCTGQTPNTALLAGLDEALVEPRSRHARVHRTLQVASRTVYEEDSSVTSAALTTAITVSATVSAAAADETKDAEEALAQLALADTADATDANESDDDITPYPHIFAIGDAAAAFGAIPAGHNAYAQGEVAARNVLRLVQRAETSEKKGEKAEEALEELEEYTPGPPAIKVSLGLERGVYQVGPNIGVKTDGVPDLQAAAIWPYFGIKVDKDEDMRA